MLGSEDWSVGSQCLPKNNSLLLNFPIYQYWLIASYRRFSEVDRCTDDTRGFARQRELVAAPLCHDSSTISPVQLLASPSQSLLELKWSDKDCAAAASEPEGCYYLLECHMLTTQMRTYHHT